MKKKFKNYERTINSTGLSDFYIDRGVIINSIIDKELMGAKPRSVDSIDAEEGVY